MVLNIGRRLPICFYFFYIQGDGTDEVGTDYANLGESKRI